MKAVYEDFYIKEEVTLEIMQYHNGNLAIQMWCYDDNFKEPFSMLTTNLGEKLSADKAYVDTNNLRTGFDFILKYNLGELVGFGQSGFCTYPLVKFNLDEVVKYDRP